MKKLVIPLTALVIATAAAAAGFRLLQNWNDPISGSSSELTEIGSITSATGEVSSRPPLASGFQPIQAAKPLYNQELLLTGHASEAVFELKSGAVLRLHENARLVAELDASRTKAIVITLLDGQVSLVNAGAEGLLRIFREGKELDLAALQGRTGSGPTSGSAPIISVSPPALSTPTEDEGQIFVASTPAETPEASPSPSSADLEPSSEKLPLVSETLTDDEIVTQLKKQTGFFQRCYLTFINRKQTTSGASQQTAGASGVVIVGFTIQGSGRVKETRVVRSDFNDATLHKCILEVIERTPFRPFASDEIPVEEFPIALR